MFAKLGTSSILVDCKKVKKGLKVIGFDDGKRCVRREPKILKDKCKRIKATSTKKIKADSGKIFTTVRLLEGKPGTLAYCVIKSDLMGGLLALYKLV